MSSQDGSDPSSYDSEHYGDVARAGFTRMYVLTYSSLSPLDQYRDYRSERLHGSDDDGDEHKMEEKHARDDGRRQRYETLEDAFDEDSGVERFQLLYASGRHYFHGVIPMPEELLDDDQDEGSVGSDSDEDAECKTGMRCQTSRPPLENRISVADLPLLLPHFQTQQDTLTAIEQVTDFRQELRDVIYQMEEVGEFMVEELSKEKLVARIEDGAKEFHWMVSPENPTFFELQTYRRANEGLVDAGVVLVVMKIVVRGVLLDVIFHKDSYFVTLRENADELALEDTFVPNVNCVGPCFVVRRYNDADLKRLLLWCSLPSDPQLTLQGSSPTKPTSTHEEELPSQSTSVKVVPVLSDHLVRSASARKKRLQANDVQVYYLLPSQARVKTHSSIAMKKRKCLDDDSDDEGSHTLDDDLEHDADVIFSFNNFVYHGTAHVRPALLDDVGKLSATVLPLLKAQALESLTFFGAMKEYVDQTEFPPAVQWSTHVQTRLDQIATTLLDLLFGSQQWVENFLNEINTIAEETTKTRKSAQWLGSHLRAWLEADDGMEFFYEVELRVSPLMLWGAREDDREDLRNADVDLLIWKGVVNQAVLIIVYRRGSFYMVLRPVEDVAQLPVDGMEFFGLLPNLADGKGRGYLIHQFPTPSPGPRDQRWLSGAKLLLWQTGASVAREDLAAEEAQAKWRQSHQDEERTTSKWFNEDEHPTTETNASTSESRRDQETDRQSVRRPEIVHAKAVEDTELPSPQSRSTSVREKVGKRHHLAPLPGTLNTMRPVQAPWDLRTGRPV